MVLYKISATPSTNLYLKELIKKTLFQEEILVLTHNQTMGRGQRGNAWYSQSGKSLTFSVLKDVFGLEIKDQFYIAMAVSLALKRVLDSYKIPEVKIKWPNDILSSNKKLCGILIENTLKEAGIKSSIIGIGLNVNETNFDNLPNAASMKILTNVTYDLEEVLNNIVDALAFYFLFIKENRYNELKDIYLLHLFGKDKVSTFKSAEGLPFNGIIRSVSPHGMLQVELEDESIREFNLKEIEMMVVG